MVGSLRNLRASFTGTLLVVDESTLVSGEWMRGLPGITTATGVPPGVALLGDEHQLDGGGGEQALRTTAAGRDDGGGDGGELPPAHRQAEVDDVS